MPAFLEKVADHIIALGGTDISRLCVVLPNRRAGLFLLKYLQERIPAPTWAPEIFAIEDFIGELSGLQPADQAEQLFVLYSIYAREEGNEVESFDMFSRWAPALLNDFNEIDSYLVNAQQLFSNLADIRTIENWSLGESQLTEFQRQYMKFWDALGRWYFAFTQQLRDDGLVTTGMAARRVAQTAQEVVATKQWSTIVFAGFNALTKAEETIIHQLRKSGKAEVLWDTDRYLFDDPTQEAGRFHRQFAQSLFRPLAEASPVFEHIEDRLSTEAKKISITGVARHVAQAKAASYFLSTLPENELQSPKTAVVLADEQLLLPMLHALPEAAQHVNITMGYPLRHTAIASLSDVLFNLHDHARRFDVRSREGELKYYHRDLSSLLRHPWLRLLFTNTRLPERLDEELGRRNMVFIALNQLRSTVSITDDEFTILHYFLQPWNTIQAAFDGLQSIINLFRIHFNQASTETIALDREFLFQFSRIVNRMQTLSERWSFMSDLRTLRLLMAQQIAQGTLPFYGEPLEGLQIMGLLETRTLDFDNIVLLSANENILPSGRSQHSFIVFDLRKAFGLPAWYERDAIFAYHFYHLLQRAKNIFILYNTESDTFGSGEKSRFLTQLLHELPEKNSSVRIEESLFDSGVITNSENAAILVTKNDDIQERLQKLADSGFSPSALNSYRSCSLQFYFRYIAQVQEADEVEEVIGVDTLGTVIHATLEELYTNLCGRAILPVDIKQLQQRAPSVCEKKFAEIYSADEMGHGKNFLTKRIALHYLQRYFDQELRRINRLHKAGIPFIVQALETELRTSIELDKRTITLRGTADRIDQIGDTVQLIDYKTGKASDKELRFADWNEIQTNAGIGKSFQLLMYALLYQRENAAKTNLSSGIISFRELSKGIKKVQTPDGDMLTASILNHFEAELHQLLQTIFDPSLAFQQTEDREICRICSFASVCGRD